MDSIKKDKINSYILFFAWFVSIIATVGSLFFSEVLHFIPCDLCWYQRIFMYPLPILLGIAAYKQDFNVITYILPLPIIGSVISIYHYCIQQFPSFAAARPCKNGVPCSGDYLNYFGGLVTIPFLALIASLLIIVSLVVIYKRK